MESGGYTDKKRANYKNWLEKQAQVSIKVSTDFKAKLDSHVATRGESLRAFIIRSATEQMQRDNESKL